jgi:hypothetical protein
MLKRLRLRRLQKEWLQCRQERLPFDELIRGAETFLEQPEPVHLGHFGTVVIGRKPPPVAESPAA